jgi:hypothetical protein
MSRRVYFFIRTLCDIIPTLWEATRHISFNVGVFYCDNQNDWNNYLDLCEKIGQIVDPNFKHQRKKGKIGAKLTKDVIGK